MATKQRITRANRRFPSGKRVARRRGASTAEDWTREELIALAVARGCRHYAPSWPELPAVNGSLSHEELGCALLRGPEDVLTFEAIRCGAMVLSDLGNDPVAVASAASRMGVVERVAHIARTALTADDHPVYWQRILEALPSTEPAESDFLPGVSRFVSESPVAGLGRGPVRRWLRTDFSR